MPHFGRIDEVLRPGDSSEGRPLPGAKGLREFESLAVDEPTDWRAATDSDDHYAYAIALQNDA